MKGNVCTGQKMNLMGKAVSEDGDEVYVHPLVIPDNKVKGGEITDTVFPVGPGNFRIQFHILR